MSEQELIAGVLAGDPGAERGLYDAHVERVYRMAYRMLGDVERAKDAVQDTFIRVFRQLRTFRGEASLGTWIGAIAISTALNEMRKVRRLRTRELPLEAGAAVGSSPRDAEPDLKTRLYGAIDALPEGYRTVFVLHDVEGYTHEEIGTMLGIQSGTSKAQLFRARNRLREALADFALEQA